MKAQMKKLGASNTATSASQESPTGSSTAIAASRLQRPGSSSSRIPSALSVPARDSPPLQAGSLHSPTIRAHGTLTICLITPPECPTNLISSTNFPNTINPHRHSKSSRPPLKSPPLHQPFIPRLLRLPTPRPTSPSRPRRRRRIPLSRERLRLPILIRPRQPQRRTKPSIPPPTQSRQPQLRRRRRRRRRRVLRRVSSLRRGYHH